jgi:hypothetical protein
MSVPRPIWVPLVVVACIFSIGLHFYNAHGEAYEFANAAIRKSPVIQRRVGNVQEVRLGILERYKEKYVGTNKFAFMTLRVVGSSGSARVEITSKRVNSVWTIMTASMDDESINLN